MLPRIFKDVDEALKGTKGITEERKKEIMESGAWMIQGPKEGEEKPTIHFFVRDEELKEEEKVQDLEKEAIQELKEENHKEEDEDDIKGPQGPNDIKGPQGPKGPKGPNDIKGPYDIFTRNYSTARPKLSKVEFEEEKYQSVPSEKRPRGRPRKVSPNIENKDFMHIPRTDEEKKKKEEAMKKQQEKDEASLRKRNQQAEKSLPLNGNEPKNNGPEIDFKPMKTVKKDIIGTVLSVKDGVAFITGLPQIRVGELVEFLNKDLFGMALNLEKNKVGVIVFGDDTKIKQGNKATIKNRLVSIKVGKELLGRVVDGLGNPIDGKKTLHLEKEMNIERKAPGVITRKSVTRPLLTGYKIVDSMLPIGRGQRELILGDRQTGKTTIGIDTILNQAYLNQENIDVNCIYVGIGQKKSSILNLQTLLEEKGALFYSTIVAATASQSASLQFIAPYTAALLRMFSR